MRAVNPLMLREAQKGEPLNRRGKLLFLGYPFRPGRGAGTVRTWCMAKWLTKLGWDVTVVTLHPSIWRRADDPVETGDAMAREGIRHIFTDHGWRCLSGDMLRCWSTGPGWLMGGICRRIARSLRVDRCVGWIKAGERACATLTADDVDVILATGPPFSAFTLAKRLSEKLNRPYVLDYRDLWTRNAHAPRPYDLRKEALLIAGSSAVTIVTPSWGMVMDSQFKLGPKLQVVPNSFDSDELTSVAPYDFGHFAIVYAGTFYPPKRVISPVLAALKRLEGIINNESRKCYFHYYGKDEEHVRKEAVRFGVMDRVVLHGSVPRSQALSAVRGAGVTVVITSVEEEATLEDKGIVTGKLYEVVGLGAPILLVAPPGSDTETIAQATGLARAFSGSDVDGIASFLSEAMRGWVPQPRNLELYAWPSIAKKLDGVLRGVAHSTTCSTDRGCSLLSASESGAPVGGAKGD